MMPGSATAQTYTVTGTVIVSVIQVTTDVVWSYIPSGSIPMGGYEKPVVPKVEKLKAEETERKRNILGTKKSRWT